MKSILILCGVVIAAIAGLLYWNYGHREDQFGKPFVGYAPASLADLTAKPEAFLGKQVSIGGRLKRQCPATGCWFFLTDPTAPAGPELKVEMGDTTPRLPARLGKYAHVEGQLIKYGEGYEFIGVAVKFE